jgi:hypothetical protein
MSKNVEARSLEPQQCARSRNRLGMAAFGLILLVVVGILAAVWRTGANGNVATGATNAIGSQVNQHPTENDVAGLQAAERGTVGKPVLVWFHSDW